MHYAAMLEVAADEVPDVRAGAAAAGLELYRVWPSGHVTIMAIDAATRELADAAVVAATGLDWDRLAVRSQPY